MNGSRTWSTLPEISSLRLRIHSYSPGGTCSMGLPTMRDSLPSEVASFLGMKGLITPAAVARVGKGDPFGLRVRLVHNRPNHWPMDPGP